MGFLRSDRFYQEGYSWLTYWTAWMKSVLHKDRKLSFLNDTPIGKDATERAAFAHNTFDFELGVVAQ
jgi:hypothetical protein